MRKKKTFIAALLSFMMIFSFAVPKEVKGYVLNKDEIIVDIDPDDVIQDQMLNWVIRCAINKTPDRSYAKLTKEDLSKNLPEIYYSESDHYDLYEFNVFVKSIEGLQYATDTERILLPYNLISDLKPIANLTKLTKIVMNDNPISDLTPLSNLTNLKILRLGDNKITNIEPLAKLTELERLNLEINKINDISLVKNFTKLKYLNLSNNSISDITSLKDLIYLEDGLILGNNNIQDISSLADITKLKELDISSNNISDISVLKNLRNLKILRLSNNSGINDIAPLTNLTQLDKNELWLTDTGIADKKDDLFKVIDVNKLINKFKANYITLEDKEYVEAARAAYDALTPELQKYIPEIRITAAEDNIARLEKGEQIKHYDELNEFDKQPIELGDFKTLQFKVEDKNGQPLSGVKFNLQTKYGYIQNELTSDENGIVKHTISNADLYMDYQIVLLDNDKYTSDIEKITFKTDGTPKITELNGMPATGTEKLKFVLTAIGEDVNPVVDSNTLQIKAVNKNGNPISGVQFNIYDQNDEATASLTSDENGIARYSITKNMTYMDFTVDIADKDKYTTETGKITFAVGAAPEITKINGKAFTGKEDLKFIITVNGEVDKTSLETAINDAKSKDASKYTEESYKQLTDALVAAEAILTKEDATQEEVNASTKNVQEAIVKLVEKSIQQDTVDSNTLQIKAIDKNGKPISGVKFNIYDQNNEAVASLTSDENGIARYSITKYMTYMDFTVDIADKNKYTTETEKITFAVGATPKITKINGKDFTGKEDLKFIITVNGEVDKTSLEKAINDAESKDASKYTEESYKQLADALVSAKAILTKADATQEEVNTSAKNVQEAIAKLVEKSTQQDTVDSNTLQIKAIDKNGKPISGVKFNINDQNNEAVASLTSDENGIATYSITKYMTYMDFTVDIADKDKYTTETGKIIFAVGATPEITKINGKAFTGKEDLKFIITVNGEDTTVKVDKTSLEKAINDAESKNPSKYTEESYKQLTDALVVAKAILTKADATQEEVDTNTTNIINAIGKLVEKSTIPEGVDNKTLQFKVLNKNAQPISGAKFNISNNYNKNVVEVISDENGIVKYTIPNWMIYMNFKVELVDNDKYTSEINNITFTTGSKDNELYIKEVNGQPFTGKEDLNFVLKATSEDVKPAVDKTKLENAIKDAESKDANKYTEESYKQLTEVLVPAKAILIKADATQEEVDTNTTNIINAIAKLVEKSTTPETKLETTTEVTSVSTVASDNNNTSNEKNNTLPKTGGVSEGMSVLLGSLLCSIGAIMFLSKKRN